MALKRMWHRLGIYGELESLKVYLDKLDTYLEEAKEELESQPLLGFFLDELWRYDEVFPRTLRNSFLVTIYSYLENELVWICESLRRKKAIPISCHDLRGSTLEQCKVYLSKLCEIEFPTGRSWVEINCYNTIRNCIVHHAGRVGGFSREKELRDYCSKQEGISIDRGGNLVLSKEFCLQAISTLQVFFEELYESYEGKQAHNVSRP